MTTWRNLDPPARFALVRELEAQGWISADPVLDFNSPVEPRFLTPDGRLVGVDGKAAGLRVNITGGSPDFTALALIIVLGATMFLIQK